VFRKSSLIAIASAALGVTIFAVLQQRNSHQPPATSHQPPATSVVLSLL
jgi:hypothetical protein